MSKNRRVKDIVEYLKEVSDIKAKWPNSTLAFRGQKNEEWLSESSAERRLKVSLPSQKEITDSLFLEYNEDLIEKCRRKNYDKREQKQLDDLELLADLQHNGAATCLTDFTRNALVALWFACQKSDDADGKVFVVNIADQRTFWEITHTDIKDNSISKILKFKIKTREPDYPISGILVASPKFWYWIPAHLNERIPAQHSLFLFGLPSSGELGAEEIIIESASKEQILKELEALHDICEESLFPDFVGFSNIQRADALYLTLDAEEYFYSGVKAQQRGQYSESIQDLTKAIELKEDYAEAYYARGLAYDRKGEYDQAIQDLTRAIELKEDYAE
ncbi:MAG: FRG domain-containing protein, partial [Gemmatimonadetes bacterium]|nr:FRG domain-containing protein [Gemmatimonadota bacterium]